MKLSSVAMDDSVGSSMLRIGRYPYFLRNIVFKTEKNIFFNKDIYLQVWNPFI